MSRDPLDWTTLLSYRKQVNFYYCLIDVCFRLERTHRLANLVKFKFHSLVKKTLKSSLNSGLNFTHINSPYDQWCE